MAELTKTQVNEAAFTSSIGIKERKVPIARSKKEERVHSEFFGALRKRAENRGYDESLKKWEDGDTDEAKIDKNIAERVGGRKVSEKTGKELKTIPKVDDARDAIKKADTLTRIVLEKPLSEIADFSPEQRTLIESGKTALKGMGRDGQFLLDEYAGDPAGLDALVWEGLKTLDETGEVRGAILKRYQEVHNGTRKVSEKEQKEANKIQKAEDALIANKAAKEKNAEEHEAAIKEKGKWDTGKPNDILLQEAITRVNEFLAPGGTPLVPGKTPAEIEKIFKGRDTLQARIDNLRVLVNNARTIKSGSLKTYENQLMQALEDQNVALTFGADYDKVAGPRNNIQAQKDAAIKNENDLAIEGGELETGEKNLLSELYTAKSGMEKARLEAAEEYVKDAQNVVTDAIKGMYRERYEDALLAEAEVINKAIETETDPAKKALMIQIRNGRWRKIDESKLSKVPALRRGKDLGHGEVERLNHGQIRTDIFLLRQEGGDKLVAAQMLREVKDAYGNGVYSEDQIKDIVSSESFKPMLQDIKINLVARAIQAGELKTSDKEMIIDIYGSASYKAALEKHKTFIEGEKKRMNFIGSTKEFFKKHPKLPYVIALGLIMPQTAMIGIAGYSIYKLSPRGGHGGESHGGGHGKKDEKYAVTDQEEEEKEKKEKKEKNKYAPIDIEEARRRKEKEEKEVADEDTGEAVA